jgi:hypothetical protein
MPEHRLKPRDVRDVVADVAEPILPRDAGPRLETERPAELPRGDGMSKTPAANPQD